MGEREGGASGVAGKPGEGRSAALELSQWNPGILGASGSAVVDPSRISRMEFEEATLAVEATIRIQFYQPKHFFVQAMMV
jgi:hypothetical protein